MIKKIKILLVIASLALTLSLMSNTYSRYVAGATGNLDMVFAKWQILVNDTDITGNNSSAINLVPVIDENANVATNKIAPSTKGHFDIVIDPSNVDLSFDYAINLSVTNDDMPDLMITKYAILDEDYIDNDEITTTPIDNNMINGNLDYNNEIENFAFEPFTIRVYFEWYDGVDEQMTDEDDTAIGNKAATEDIPLEITATINFNQK